MCSFKTISVTDLLFLILCAKGSMADKENEGDHGHLSHKFFPSARSISKNFSYYLSKSFQAISYILASLLLPEIFFFCNFRAQTAQAYCILTEIVNGSLKTTKIFVDLFLIAKSLLLLKILPLLSKSSSLPFLHSLTPCT